MASNSRASNSSWRSWHKCRAVDERAEQALAVLVMQSDGDVLDGGEVAEEADVLKSAGDAAAVEDGGRESVDALAGEFDGSGGWRVDAGDEIEGRGLASTVGSDESDEFAGIDGEGEAADAVRPPNRTSRLLQVRRGI